MTTCIHVYTLFAALRVLSPFSMCMYAYMYMYEIWQM